MKLKNLLISRSNGMKYKIYLECFFFKKKGISNDYNVTLGINLNYSNPKLCINRRIRKNLKLAKGSKNGEIDC